MVKTRACRSRAEQPGLAVPVRFLRASHRGSRAAGFSFSCFPTWLLVFLPWLGGDAASCCHLCWATGPSWGCQPAPAHLGRRGAVACGGKAGVVGRATGVPGTFPGLTRLVLCAPGAAASLRGNGRRRLSVTSDRCLPGLAGPTACSSCPVSLEGASL